MLTFSNVFKEYTAAGSVPVGGFKEEDLDRGPNQHKKVAAIKKIFELAKQSIKGKAEELFSDFNVDFVITALEQVESNPEQDESNPEQDIDGMITGYKPAAQSGKSDLKIPINLDFDKIGKQPPHLVYSIIYSNMHKALLSKKEQMMSQTGILINTNDENRKGKDEQQNENQANTEKSFADIVLEYIAKKICDFFGLKAESPEDYKAAAKQMFESYKTETDREYTEDFFDFSQTRDAAIAELDMTNNKAREAIENGQSQLAAGYMTQATSLAEAMTENEFKAFVNGSGAELQESCKKYAYTALSLAGIQNPAFVKISFDKFYEGKELELGTYFPGENKVNINIDKIKQLNSPSEVAMTITHEITHAVDNANHAFSNNIGENIDAAKNDETIVYDFVEEMNNLSYSVNPNERRARISELEALKFMVEKYDGNANLKRSIKSSTKNYIYNQEDTIKNLKNVANPSYIANLDNQYKSLASSSKISLAAKRLIDERFSYFSTLKRQNLLSTEPEEKSIVEANKVLQELEQERQRKAETEKQAQAVSENEHEQA